MTPPLPLLDARLQGLADKQEIAEVIHRFARALDRSDWELLATCYHDDGLDDHGAFKGPVSEYVDWVRTFLPAFAESTMHTVTNVLVELDGDVAHAESHGVAYHRYTREDGTPADLIGGGRHVDRFERRNGAWKIASRLLIWEWVRDDAVTAGWEGETTGFTFGRRDKTDAVYAFGR